MCFQAGDGGEGGTGEVILGFLPSTLVTQLMDDEGRWCPTPAAVDEMCDIIRGMTDGKVLLPRLEQVFRMIAGLLRDTQFRVVMALLKTIEVRVASPVCVSSGKAELASCCFVVGLTCVGVGYGRCDPYAVHC